MWEIRTSNAKIFTFPAFNFDILTSKYEFQSKIIYYFSSPTSTPQQQYNEVFSTGFYAILMVLPIRVKKIPKFIGDCSCLGRSVAAVALKPWKVFFTYGSWWCVCCCHDDFLDQFLRVKTTQSVKLQVIRWSEHKPRNNNHTLYEWRIVEHLLLLCGLLVVRCMLLYSGFRDTLWNKRWVFGGRFKAVGPSSDTFWFAKIRY